MTLYKCEKCSKLKLMSMNNFSRGPDLKDLSKYCICSGHLSQKAAKNYNDTGINEFDDINNNIDEETK
jgi:hypothetical protein